MTITNITKAAAACANVGGRMHAAVQFPNDAHLVKVLVEVTEYHFTQRWVVWTYNVEDNGFHNGDYRRTYDAALLTFCEAIMNLTR